MRDAQKYETFLKDLELPQVEVQCICSCFQDLKIFVHCAIVNHLAIIWEYQAQLM